MKRDGRDPAFCRAFVVAAKGILSQHPEVKHSLSIDDDEDHCILDIPKQSDDGFDITIEVFPSGIILSASGAHIHFDDIKEAESTISEVFGLIRDLLSPAMRVVEQRSNEQPYKWYLESLRNGQWQREDANGLLFYNFFGKKTEKIYQNNIMQNRN